MLSKSNQKTEEIESWKEIQDMCKVQKRKIK